MGFEADDLLAGLFFVLLGPDELFFRVDQVSDRQVKIDSLPGGRDELLTCRGAALA